MTAHSVSSGVGGWALRCCGNFLTSCCMAYLPTSSLLRSSIARLRSAVAAAHTTRSEGKVSRSTRCGRPFSLRTEALISTAGCNVKDKNIYLHNVMLKVFTNGYIGVQKMFLER